MGFPAHSTTDPQNLDAVAEVVLVVACVASELPLRLACGAGLRVDMNIPAEKNLQDAIDFFRDVDYKYRVL